MILTATWMYKCVLCAWVWSLTRGKIPTTKPMNNIIRTRKEHIYNMHTHTMTMKNNRTDCSIQLNIKCKLIFPQNLFFSLLHSYWCCSCCCFCFFRALSRHINIRKCQCVCIQICTPIYLYWNELNWILVYSGLPVNNQRIWWNTSADIHLCTYTYRIHVLYVFLIHYI